MNRELHLCTDWEVGLSYALHWVKQTAQRSLSDERQAAIILPNFLIANRLRKILALDGVAFINVHFWTPTAFRRRMLGSLTEILPIASREELHLIASSVAGLDSGKRRRSTEVDPDSLSLLGVLNLLNSFKSEHVRIPDELRSIEDLAKNFRNILKEQELQMVSEADCFLASRKWQEEFTSLLIFGFHGGHRSLFPLLSVAHRTTEDLKVVLENPDETSLNLDSPWIESWEQLMGVQASLLGEQEGEQERKRRSLPPQHVEFLTEPTTYNLAWAIAMRASRMVAEGAKMVAVVFSTYGSLSRETALAMNRLRLPYFDGIGHACLPPKKNHWREWCAFQEAPTAQSLFKFLALLPDQARAANLLREASCETLSQDILVCTRFANLRSDREEDRKKLSSFSLLPERSSLAEFCRESAREFVRLGWAEEASHLQACQVRFRHADRLLLKRNTFLRWLQSALQEKCQLQDPMGSHPYATIQLVLRDQAALCPWTHVILAGMNIGQWPDSGEENGSIPFISSLYQNTASSPDTELHGNSPSSSGTAPPAFSYYISHLCQKEQQTAVQRQRRDFQNLCKAAVVIATTQMRNNGDVTDYPSTWFSELYERYGKTNKCFCTPSSSSQPHVPFIAAASLNKYKSVWKARTARLDPTLSFGCWEFVTPPPSFPLEINVTDAGRIWKEPAIVWMKIFLGIDPAEMIEGPAIRITGIWVHRWLRNLCVSATNWARLPDKSSRRQIILSASEDTRIAVEKSYHAVRRQLPRYWVLIWKQAKSFAVECSDHLEAFRPKFPYISTERSFQNVNVGAFIVRGRWDLLLSTMPIENNLASRPFANASMIVVDYKVVKRLPNIASPSLSGRDVGIKTQLALYTQAALANGALRVDTACIAPYFNAAWSRIILSSKELEKVQPLLLSIGRILREGVFGMRGQLHPEFTFYNPMPLATLPIAQDVLESKWELTQKRLLAKG